MNGAIHFDSAFLPFSSFYKGPILVVESEISIHLVSWVGGTWLSAAPTMDVASLSLQGGKDAPTQRARFYKQVAIKVAIQFVYLDRIIKQRNAC